MWLKPLPYHDLLISKNIRPLEQRIQDELPGPVNNMISDQPSKNVFLAKSKVQEHSANLDNMWKK